METPTTKPLGTSISDDTMPKGKESESQTKSSTPSSRSDDLSIWRLLVIRDTKPTTAKSSRNHSIVRERPYFVIKVRDPNGIIEQFVPGVPVQSSRFASFDRVFQTLLKVKLECKTRVEDALREPEAVNEMVARLESERQSKLLGVVGKKAVVEK